MKFLCDQMLARVGRWLRAAGHDTVIIESPCDDRIILVQAQKEKRLLLTRDTHFLEMSDPSHVVVWLQGNTVEECIREMNQKLTINWLKHPFSRCLECNAVLKEISPEEGHDVPQDILDTEPTLWACPECDKTYWEGSHTKRMLNTLNRWSIT